MTPLPHPTLPVPAFYWLQGGTAVTFRTLFVTGGNLKLGYVSDSSLSPGLPSIVYSLFVKSVDGRFRARGWLAGGRKGRL